MNYEMLAQIQEKIETIEARLLGLENISSEGIDPQVAVHLLFRDFHNLKSTLSMNGADVTAKLVHEAESCLDALRSGKGNGELGWIDLLLEVVDHVKNLSTSEEEKDAPDLSRKLNILLETWLHHPSEIVREIGFPLVGSEAHSLQKVLKKGFSTYILEKLVGENMEEFDIKNLPVFETIEEIGTLVAWRLVQIKGSGSVLTIVFATDKEKNELPYIFFDPYFPVAGYKEEQLSSEGAISPNESDLKTFIPDKLRRLLIVEDEIVALMMLQHYLAPYGRIDTAENGNEAWEKFSQALKSGDPYHVIFLDILIPGISGNLVLTQIRKMEHDFKIPLQERVIVVMESSLSDYTSIASTFQNQSDVYLVKPITSEAVENTMEKLGYKKIVFQSGSVPSSLQ